MANVTIDQLTGKTSVATDQLEVQATAGGASNKVTVASAVTAGAAAITVPAVNTTAIGVTGYSLTGTDATGMIDLAGTVNTTGNPVMLKIALTNTASGATTKFLSFLAGASGTTEEFKVEKDGTVTGKQFLSDANGTGSSPNFGYGSSGMYITSSGGEVFFTQANTYCGRITSSLWGAKAAGIIGFESAGAATALDIAFARNAAGVVEVNNGTAGTYRDLIARSLFSAPSSANGQSLGIKSLTELTTIAASATTDTTIEIPAHAVVFGVSVRVTTIIPNAATFTVGDAGSATRYSTALVSTAANSTNPGTAAGAYYNTTAANVVLTFNTAPLTNTGRVRVTIHYYDVTPPTS